jgi:uncharacterized protein (UPF0332 family)
VTARDAKREAVRSWWTKANDSLAAAQRELAAGALAFAINRAYYALFYAVTALFLEEGREFSKHAGVRAAFNQAVIKAGRLEKQYGELYNTLFADREAADYVAFMEFHPYRCGRKGCQMRKVLVGHSSAD